MSTSLRAILTQQGLQAAFDASQNGLQIAIAEVAVGTSGYSVAVNGDALATQTALVAERKRVPIGSASVVGGHQIDISFLIDGSGEFWVREVGYFLEDGTLFAVWSDATRALAWKGVDVPLVLGLELVMTQLPSDAVTVISSGPELQLIMTREAAIAARAIADLQLRALRLTEALEALEQTAMRVVPGGSLAFDAEAAAWRARIVGHPGELSYGREGLRITNIPLFADAGAAGAAGLDPGTLWRDPAGIISII